ncbi:ATP-dependent protease La Type I [Lachnospiraceae bacterium TWA4]|nr:ATP-dependent protease La Type I [Lachnospiraceae bacterium TWA4]
MIIIPMSDSLILPNTTIQINKNNLDDVIDVEIHANDEVVILLKKANQSRRYYPIGFLGNVIHVENAGDVSIEVKERLTIEEVDIQNQSVVYNSRAEIADMDEAESEKQFSALKRQIIKVMSKYQGGAYMSQMFFSSHNTWNKLIVGYAPYMNLTNEEVYEIMKVDSESERVALITKAVQEVLALFEVSQEAKEDSEESFQKAYKETAIKKQIKYLQKQLDDLHPEDKSQIQIFEEKIEESGMNETAKKEALKVLRRLKTEGQDGHESGMLYDYLDFVTSLDWKKNEANIIDLNKAQEILDSEHYGLKKVKKRIIEQMAVMALSKKQSGSILLFVGAPGTGKTSIAHSIAEALGREYVRISLGGVRDEADIRGHRRTYIGAMPGRIMDGMKKSGSSNPVMVLDEIDKLSTSYNGDPASALLEVLDPEQNFTFTDHYMNVPYDLSDVFFICTANSLDTIPGPLLDRMEVIQFNGYTPLEKLQIGKRHLLKKAMEKNGIEDNQLTVTDEAMEHIISGYTMEGGVRGLKKQLDKLSRFAAVKLVKDHLESVEVTTDNLADFMDQREIHHDKVQETKEPGIVTGLAWTAVGGEILFIETMLTKGKGKIIITGQLGDVMKESAQIAVSLVKKMYPDKAKLFEENDLHIHVPAGATPKDGPSAGITLTTALTSLINEKPVSPEYAMTGEVSLRGNVMPIGGLPEKLMAAQRAGVKSVFIPKENQYDLKDVAPEVLSELQIIPVEKVQDVLNIAM